MESWSAQLVFYVNKNVEKNHNVLSVLCKTPCLWMIYALACVSWRLGGFEPITVCFTTGGTWKIAVLGSELPVGKLVEIMLDVLHLPFPARFSLREENTHSPQAWHSLLPVEPNLSFDYSFNDYSIAFLDETLPIYFLPRRSGLIGNWLDGLSLRRRKFLQFVRTSTSF